MVTVNRILTDGAKIRRGNLLRDVTIRDFSGGWNVIDNDLNLSSKFAKLLQNLQRNPDGSLSVRPGTRLFADCSTYLDRILGMWYFSAHIIAAGQNGRLVAVDATGIVKDIWSDAWAATLPGTPDGWDSDLEVVTATIFNGELIVCNGVNKPLTINSNLAVTYLQDLATNSNTNTPIGKYVRTHGRYVVIAGIPGALSTIAISATDIAGTWFGDAAPNDALNLDLGSRVPKGSEEIRGLGRFRDRLVVAFDEVLLPGTLGEFNTAGDHVPVFDDAIDEHGSVGHRVIENIGEDMLFCDTVGVPALTRALFTGNVRPDRPSQLVDPEIQKSIGALTDAGALEHRTHAVYDGLDYNYMLFIPNHDLAANTTETRGFIYKRIEKLKVQAWSEWLGWNWSASARSALRRVFHARDALIFIQGNNDDVINADFVGEQETFSDGTTFKDQTGWTPVADEDDSGVPIEFVWELPWSDNNARFDVKDMRFISFDTKGHGRFTVELFVDNIYLDTEDPGETFQDETLFDDDTGFDVDVLDPTLSMEFVGGDTGGFGQEGFGDDGYGGGRPTNIEKLYQFTARYKIAKLRISGETQAGGDIEPLKFISVTMGYLQGSIRR